MLNEGPTAEPWCPPGLNSVDELSVVTAGKNLLNFRDNLAKVTRNGITFTPNPDGTVTVDGESTADDNDYYLVGSSYNGRAECYLPKEQMVFSSNGRAKLYGFSSSGEETIGIITNNSNAVITAEEVSKTSKFICYLSYSSGQGETNKRVFAQLELGSTATDYEPPNVTTTPIDLDGNSLCSLPDGTCDELVIEQDGSAYIEKKVGLLNIPSGDDGWYVFDDGKDYVNGTRYNSIDFINYGDGGCRPNSAYSGAFICDKYAVKDDGYFDVNFNANLLAITSNVTCAWMVTSSNTAIQQLVLLYPLATPQTIKLPSVTLPSLPSDKSNIYTTSNVPVTSLTVRYWKKSGELVANLYDKLAQLQGAVNSIQEVVMQS